MFGSSLFKNDGSVSGRAAITGREEEWRALLRVQGMCLFV